MRAYELGLQGHALAGALALEARFPAIVFTSGRRSLADQAHAMAANIAALGLHGRDWIGRTYVRSVASLALQAWVTSHPGAVTVEALSAGLLERLETLGEDAAGISRHLTGEAFDVQPVVVV